MKFRAAETAVCTEAIASSEDSMAAVASPAGSTSSPLRKGISASATLSKAASVATVSSLPSRTKASLMTRSRCSFVSVMSSPMVFSPALPRSNNFCRAGFIDPGTPVTAVSSTRVEALSTFWLAAREALISSTSVSVGLAASMPKAASSAPGFTLFSAALTATSASATLASSSASTALPLMSRSPEPAAFRAFDSSVCAAERRPESLDNADADSWPLASRCFCERIFLAFAIAAPASFSAAPVFSMASFKVSTETDSRSSVDKTSATPFNTTTFFSVSETASTTSANKAAILRSEVSFLNMSNFFTTTSNLDW
mmetsp:Transcript_91578/g.255866  ORF Transcript_91578/g.255866 Transcript_91578/m.255866 type:complete len:313 (+) Transcript_91578:3334-4272(+)